MDEILKIVNLTKLYGKVVGVQNLSLSLNEGEIFGFIGPNGAGKSTTIRTIMNLINKNNGDIFFLGKKLNKEDIKLKTLIGYLPSEVNLYDDLTVKQMLDYHQQFYKNDISNRRKELVERLNIDESKKIEDLSLGNLKKVAIVLAFMHQPKLLILDEPTSGLDPIMQQEFFQLLLEEKSNGTTILYSTHILSEISKICDRVGIIKDGHLLKVESIQELKNKNLTYVTIQSENNEEILKKLKIKEFEMIGKSIRFKNMDTPEVLIKKLTKLKLDKLLIEEASLEDIFLHYYQ